VNEQAEGLAASLPGRIARGLESMVLVTGGKGGVGKTTLTANLGVSMARLGRRVLVADLDLGLANLNVLLGLTPRRTLEDFLDGGRPLAGCVTRVPAGFDVLPAGSGTADMGRPDHARRARLLQALGELATSYDVVLADSPAGIGPDVLAFAGAASYVLVVTSPEPAALTDAYGVVKAIDSWSATNSVEVPTPDVAVNLVRGAEHAESVAGKLRTVCERFLSRSPRMAGWLPRSHTVLRSVAEQRPSALGDARLLEGRCIEGLARHVSRRLVREPGATAP